MKHLVKALLVGVAGFMAVRFFILLTQPNKGISDAARETVEGPANVLGTGLGLAFQPSKWTAAGQILRNAASAAQGESGADKAQVGSKAFKDLQSLANRKPDQPGAERAQWQKH